jgi:carbonic anhydrase
MHEVFRGLLEGNSAHARANASRFDDLQDGQAPEAVTVCCSDSRVLQDAMWANEDPGSVFTVGNIGNRVIQRTRAGETVVSGDVLYPLAYTDTETAVVVGHTGCGAVTATYDAIVRGDEGDGGDDEGDGGDDEGDGGDDEGDGGDDEGDAPAGVEHCIDLLRPRLEPGVDALPADVRGDDAVNRLVEYNVDRQVDALRESDDVPDAVTAYGVVYDFQDVYGDRRGEVHVVNVDGETDPDVIREAHPELADRVARRFQPTAD